PADSAAVNTRQYDYWSQIANYFKDYDEHLLFASANEPNVEDAAGMSVLLSYHQTFIDAVRATGGNNSSRTLVIQGPSTDIEKTNRLMNTLPQDTIEDRLMVEIHYYTPWQFCGLTEDASWGRMFYYWGKNYHSTTDRSRNATWGEEAELDRLLGLMKTKFVDKGIPIILGEYGAVKRTLTGESDQDLHLASRLYFYRYLVESAVDKGIITFNWDTGPYGNNTMGIFDRNTGSIVDQGLLDAIMQGAGKTSITDVFDEANVGIPKETRLAQNYPNPFNPTTLIDYRLTASTFVVLKVFDTRGREVKILVTEHQNAGNHSVLFDASNLQSGLYFYRLETGICSDTRKLLLLK
ncbi:cellulase family glycosylhydrolase, partial [candidate division KSB1 bacterium]|nr:cellulase family glycosylhydrolase [candidate division KSB1 bacterium]